MNCTYRKTKIIATLGPATTNEEAINTLIEAGVNVFRLNFSHGDHDTHRRTVEMIRNANQNIHALTAILADLQGPKLRIGTFKEEQVSLSAGQHFRFDLDSIPGDSSRVCLPHPEILAVLDTGKRIFLDDGNVRAKVTGKGEDYVDVIIENDSALSNRKGVNVPGVLLPIPALTDKDRIDLKAALDMEVDWIAQSFVQTPDDVKEAKTLIGDRAALMVKLEKPAALDHLDEIIDLADGIMLARGDLGVEIPPENVPAVQKRVVRRVHDAGKPIVVATQMLESMVHNPRPTRAEASDVATAVYDGADAVMLSAETAVGDYPKRAVEIMSRICHRTESDESYHAMMDTVHPETDPDGKRDPSDAITAAAYYVTEDVEAKFIVTYTSSGSTALRMARQRPHVPILCLTPHIEVARRLMISYGIDAVYAPETEDDFTGPARHAAKIALEKGLAEKGDRFILTAGMPFGVPGSTNVLRVAVVG